MANNTLTDFIKDAAKAGKTRPEIDAVLKAAGWREEELRACWARYHDAPFPVLIPLPTVYASPRLTALNAFHFLVLYISIWSTVAIIFTFLDYHLPDGLGRKSGMFYSSYQPIGSAIRSYLSSLLVAAPLVALSHRWLQKAMKNAGMFIPGMRLKLLNLTFFIAAIVLLCNFISFVYFFLSGELSLRFIIKVGVLSVLCFGLYHYFKPEIKANEEKA